MVNLLRQFFYAPMPKGSLSVALGTTLTLCLIVGLVSAPKAAVSFVGGDAAHFAMTQNGAGVETTLVSLSAVASWKREHLDFSRQSPLRTEAAAYNVELKCLAEAIYYEARSENFSGQLAVADVVLNRVSSGRYPDSICKVVYQGASRSTGCQFSFACNGSTKKAIEATAWRKADRLAHQVMLGVVPSVTRDATHYHADYVDPKWASKLVRTVQIGRHIFYRTAG